MLGYNLLCLWLMAVCAAAQIATEDLSAFISQAHETMAQRFRLLEPQLYMNGIRQKVGSPAWFMAHPGKPESKNITHVALMAEEATKYMAHALGLSGADLRGLSTSGTALARICPSHESPWCEARKYRSLSGHCNNVQSPSWGSAGTPYIRFLPPDYEDTISLPRGTAIYPDGLPSAREVSLAVHNQLDRIHSHLVATAAFWAQMVAYDVSLTPKMTGYNGERLKCCGVEFSDFHPECFPIRLPDADPIHGSARCQEYVRSATAPRKACSLGPREQLNEATSFLDASNLYGTSQEDSDDLRLFKGGLLKLHNGLLPSDNKTECRPNNRFKCFRTADTRMNEHVGLAALQNIWAREHNRLAAELAKLNPHWPDEILFQEARKIVIAEIQYITFNEFLPLILGKDTMAAHSLSLDTDGYFQGYKINENPGIANSVASAALHFSVSLMPTMLKYYDSEGNEIGEDSLGNSFYAPFHLYAQNGLESVMQSLLRVSALNNNQHVNSIFTDHMFEQPDEAGLDLIAQLIQQGRDHGVPSYQEWRRFCNLLVPNTFEDLEGDLTSEAVNDLRRVYKNVSDIDLLSGALSEQVPDGATVGPTLRCLLAKQFKSLRSGDRHWFENDWAGFTKSQLNSIREGASLARIICDNTEVKYVQPNAFLAQDPFLNAPMPCSSGTIKSLDMSFWKEQKKLFIIPSSVLAETFKNAQSDVRNIHKREWLLYTHNLMADPQSPIGTAFGFSRPKRQAAKIANTSLMLEFASSRIVRSFIQGELQDLETKDVNSLISTLPFVDLSFIDDIGDNECLDTALPCDYTQKYRTISGWCNNLEHPDYGQSFRAFNRFLPPAYTDGVGTPRALSVTGKQLPSPRLISTNIHSDTSRPHTRYSLMVMQFAQITDHDLTFTPVNKGFINEGILNCLSCDSKETVHPECFPIPIPDNDPYFPSKDPNTGKNLCIPATRSMPGQQTLGPREQMNQLTAYLDLSYVYGSDNCEARILRSFSGGKLNVTRVPYGKSLLPESRSNPECRSRTRICFNAGDARASEQPALGSFHTVWLREHNRIAHELSKINPHWSDETLYQETRKILAAVYQHLTFSEFLPRILGREAIKKYNLDLLLDGYFKGYDPTCDATVVNEFSSGAFRFGHSLLRPGFRRVSPEYIEKGTFVMLRDHFFNPEVLYTPGIIDEILLGLIDTPMETLDNFITKEVTEHLFENKSRPFSGMDLISLNIQRARDHGVSGYNDYREACGLKRANSFDDFLDTISEPIVAKLSELYEHVDDVDFFPGGMSEYPLHGGVIGPTFACIIGNQFSRIRRCDRFWYENDQEFTRFTPLQLAEIRKTTIAALFCNNLDNIYTIQRAVLDLPDPFMNPRVKCKTIPQIDLTHWKERASCFIENVSIDTGRTINISPCVSCTCTKEGPICQSIKVKNCISLLHNYTPDAVANDTVCKVQCLYIFKVVQEYTQSQTNIKNIS
ncbi:unnamed protein product [Nezara viridula]|uniref:Peroxidase n=1 Tax=Nezara viridula TaxID=85310 RepID=A0A9P0MPI9_NEZVI|nr:unnamed protein product [Nezara viridula]